MLRCFEYNIETSGNFPVTGLSLKKGQGPEIFGSVYRFLTTTPLLIPPF